MRRRKRKKQTKVIIIISITLLFILTTGYAAFSTDLNITAKGNIVDRGITPKELKNKVVTSGDGLYKDIYEDGRYIYRGTNPNNHITFNDESWRILSVENNNTLKLIKVDYITVSAWDSVGNRNSSIDTFCKDTNNYGCNAWAATNNLVNSPSEFTVYNPTGNKNTATSIITGKVTKDSTINTYLNTVYYNSIKDKDKINVGNFYVGSPGNHLDEEDWSFNIIQEKVYVWQGKVGLMTISEYVRASTNSTWCNSLKEGFEDSKSKCGQNNYLYKGEAWEHLITPSSTATGGIASIRPNGSITNTNPNDGGSVRPVIFTFSNIYLKGEGTETNPYTIN